MTINYDLNDLTRDSAPSKRFGIIKLNRTNDTVQSEVKDERIKQSTRCFLQKTFW